MKITGGGEDIKFGGIGFAQGKTGWVIQWIVQGFERGVRQAVDEVKLCEPEADYQVVGRKLADAIERCDGLSHVATLGQQGSRGEEEAGFVKRAVGVEHGVPVAVFAELIRSGAVGVNRCGGTSLQRAVEFEINASGDVVGINFLGVGKTCGGIGQLAGALELDAPIIERAGIKIGDEQGVGIQIRFCLLYTSPSPRD